MGRKFVNESIIIKLNSSGKLENFYELIFLWHLSTEIIILFSLLVETNRISLLNPILTYNETIQKEIIFGSNFHFQKKFEFFFRRQMMFVYDLIHSSWLSGEIINYWHNKMIRFTKVMVYGTHLNENERREKSYKLF